MVVNLLTEDIGQAGESSHAHTHGQIVPFHIACCVKPSSYVLVFVRGLGRWFPALPVKSTGTGTLTVLH